MSRQPDTMNEQELLAQAQARLLSRRFELVPFQLSGVEHFWPGSPFDGVMTGAVNFDRALYLLGLLRLQPRRLFQERSRLTLERLEGTRATRLEVNMESWNRHWLYAITLDEVKWPEKTGWYVLAVQRSKWTVMVAQLQIRGVNQGEFAVLRETGRQRVYNFDVHGEEVHGTGDAWQPFLVRGKKHKGVMTYRSGFEVKRSG